MATLIQRQNRISFSNNKIYASLNSNTLFILSLDDAIIANGKEFSNNNTIKIDRSQTEAIVDLICGNKWPAYLNEFFSLII